MYRLEVIIPQLKKNNSKSTPFITYDSELLQKVQ